MLVTMLILVYIDSIEELKRGSVIEAKHLISRQIAVLANALMVL